MTSGLAVGGCSRNRIEAGVPAPAEMRFRQLGATGLEFSEISFGSYGFDNPALLMAALDQGSPASTRSESMQTPLANR
jgi:hypothetical protein